MKKGILISLIFIVCLLTACTGLNAEQKAQWEESIAQIQLLKGTLSGNVTAVKAYYDSIDDEVKNRMNKIDFSSFVIDEELDYISMPEKEKEFDASYDLLQQKISKLNNMIDSIPTIEFIKEQQAEVEKQIKAEEEKKQFEESKNSEIKTAQQSQNTYTQKANEANYTSSNQVNPNQCWKSGCTLEQKSFSVYCVNHSCLLCSSARKMNSPYCSSHKCNKCENVVVDGSRYCVAHKCLVCNQQKFGNSQYCSKHK